MNPGHKALAIFFTLIIAGFSVYTVTRSRIWSEHRGCFTGAFLTDHPGDADIKAFEKAYGKKPYYVLVFTDWERFPPDNTIRDILANGCRPVITWEPWKNHSEGVDPKKLLAGEYDEYIRNFASRISGFDREILIRFAHEMNGDWYPWSGSIIGRENYKKMYRHVKDVVSSEGAANVKWVFSFNWENVPDEPWNDFAEYYPGDVYVDYVGIDGYNWGNTREWSRWRSFREIFLPAYTRAVKEFGKPVIISEFGSSGQGGNKAVWIRETMKNIRSWKEVKGFILFNVDKEVDWSFKPGTESAASFGKSLKSAYFKDEE